MIAKTVSIYLGVIVIVGTACFANAEKIRWEPILLPEESGNYSQEWAYHANEGSIYFGIPDKGLYKTTDGGKKWSREGEFPYSVTIYPVADCLIAGIKKGSLYTINWSKQIFKTEDCGKNWNVFWPESDKELGRLRDDGNFRLGHAAALWLNRYDNTKLFMLTLHTETDEIEGGPASLWRITNNGKEYSRIELSWGRSCPAVALGKNSICVRFNGREVMNSQDNGMTWTAINLNSLQLNGEKDGIQGLFLDEKDQLIIFCSKGVFVSNSEKSEFKKISDLVHINDYYTHPANLFPIFCSWTDIKDSCRQYILRFDATGLTERFEVPYDRFHLKSVDFAHKLFIAEIYENKKTQKTTYYRGILE